MNNRAFERRVFDVRDPLLKILQNFVARQFSAELRITRRNENPAVKR